MSQTYKPIAHLVIQRLMEAPDKAVIVTPERQMLAHELVEATLSLAWRLKQTSIDQNSILGLRTRYLFLALPAILAVSLLGCRWIDCSSSLPTEENIDASLKRLGIKVTHKLEFGDLSYTWDPSMLLADPSWLKGIPASSYKKAINSSKRAHDAWMIAQSSGATGAPKYMNIGNKEIALRLIHALPFSGIERPVSAILFPPLSLVWTLYSIATLLKSGKIVLFSQPHHLYYLNVNFVTGSPFHFQTLLNEKNWDNEFIDTASITGGAISQLLIEELEKRFKNIVQRYGSSESGIIAHGSLIRGAKDSRRIGSILPGVEIQILDINSKEPIEPGQKGIVRIRSPWSISNYIDNDLQNKLFQNGWFYSGDVGWVDDEKNLNIQGRLGDILNILGVKIDATHLDALICEIKGISDAAIFIEESTSKTPRIGVAFVSDENINTSVIAERIISFLSNNLNLNDHPYAVYQLECLPRTSTGKINRAILDKFPIKTQIF